MSFIVSFLLLLAYNLSFTRSGKISHDKNAIDINFTMELIKHGVIARLDRIRIVQSLQISQMQNQRFAIKNLKLLTQDFYTVVEVSSFIKLDIDNCTELIWFPYGVTDLQLESLRNSTFDVSLEINIFYFP